MNFKTELHTGLCEAQAVGESGAEGKVACMRDMIIPLSDGFRGVSLYEYDGVREAVQRSLLRRRQWIIKTQGQHDWLPALLTLGKVVTHGQAKFLDGTAKPSSERENQIRQRYFLNSQQRKSFAHLPSP